MKVTCMKVTGVEVTGVCVPDAEVSGSLHVFSRPRRREVRQHLVMTGERRVGEGLALHKLRPLDPVGVV